MTTPPLWREKSWYIITSNTLIGDNLINTIIWLGSEKSYLPLTNNVLGSGGGLGVGFWWWGVDPHSQSIKFVKF